MPKPKLKKRVNKELDNSKKKQKDKELILKKLPLKPNRRD